MMVSNIYAGYVIDLAYFVDSTGTPIILKGLMLEPPRINIDREGINNYACSAFQYIRVNKKGFLEIGFEHNTRIENRVWNIHPPITLRNMCVRIEGYYNFLGFRRLFYSKTFQWPAFPGQNQWIEGPVTPDLPNESSSFGETLPPAMIHCG